MKCKRCYISVQNEFIPCLKSGDGNDILFIAESPGHTENKTKVPFTGKAGKHFRKYLSLYGLIPFSTITYLIKCTTPRGREPYPEEIRACSSYLIDDISTVNPKIIILVGTTVTKILNKENKGVTTLRNKPFVIGNAIAISIFHPSHVMKNELISEYTTSFNLISEMFNKINPYYRKRRFKPKSK